MAGSPNIWSWVVWTPILITLLSGTVSSLAVKVAYSTPVEGSCGKTKFGKAYFYTVAMFIGEFLCLLVYFVKQALRKHRAASYHPMSISPALSAVNQMHPTSSFGGAHEALLSPEAAAAPKPPIYYYAILCCFDTSASTIAGIGLLWVDAGTNQMLRGSMVVFCAVFSVLMLKRKLSREQWLSIGVVCLGLILVGMSGLLHQHFDPSASGDSAGVSSGDMILGIALVLIGSALNAVQNVFEEKLLKGTEVDPLELVGYEGLFGTLLSGLVMLPIVYYIPGGDCGRAEDSISTLKQLGNSPMVLCLTLAYIVSLAAMNFTSQQISQQLSAVHRNLVSAVRTILVWIGSIILFYQTKDTKTLYNGKKLTYGEEWTNWSFIELGGFIILVVGTVMYSYFGLRLAAAQEQQEKLAMLETSRSPEFVLPIEPALAEHQQVAKQHRKRSSDADRHTTF